jgi:hypothetical protein
MNANMQHKIGSYEKCRASLGWADEGVCPYTDVGGA